MVHTCKPPYEQLLVGVVGGGESSLGAGVLIIVLPLSRCRLHPRRRASVVIDVAVSARDPTCEQLLAAGGAGAMLSWRRFGGGGGGRPVVVIWPLAPTIHPASSRSQWWGWVPLLVFVNGLWG
jgi:hypothetical protein